MPEEQPKLILLTTLGCHLCDFARKELWQAQARLPFMFSERDIALSDEDIAAYGVRIPVVLFAVSGVELDWPFCADDIVNLLE